MSSDNEVEFIDSIDACFPYFNEKEWKKLIDTGVTFSDNCSFMILHEICRAPDEIPPELLLSIYEYWNSKYNHVLKEDVCRAALSMIQSKKISVEESARMMNEIRKFPGLYTALSIPYSACDDVDGKLNDLYNEITENWKTDH